MSKTKKKQENIIKEEPDGNVVLLDHGLMNSIRLHTCSFGFRQVVPNVIEAYRREARKYNAEAEKLEQALKGD